MANKMPLPPGAPPAMSKAAPPMPPEPDAEESGGEGTCPKCGCKLKLVEAEPDSPEGGGDLGVPGMSDAEMPA